MKNSLYSLILIFVAIPAFVSAQEMIQMLDGNKLFVTILDTAGEAVKVVDPEPPRRKKAGEENTVMLEKDRIFSVTYRTGEEIIYYRQDSISREDDNLLTPEEMRSYVAGVHDAKSRYSSPGSFWACFVAGLGSGLTLPPLFSPILPVGVTYFMGSRVIRVNRTHISDPKFLQDEFYIMGYERTARSLRVQRSLGGSVAGLFLGIVASYTVLNEQLRAD